MQRGSGLGSGSRFMEEEEEAACPRRAAVRQLKQRLLEAVQANDGREVEEILRRREIDVDAVLEVEDPAMVLASYKQGEGGGEGGGGRGRGGGGVTGKMTCCKVWSAIVFMKF